MSRRPTIVHVNTGMTTKTRVHRQYCVTCRSDELHVSCVCVQCKKGGIPTPTKTFSIRFNEKRQG